MSPTDPKLRGSASNSDAQALNFGEWEVVIGLEVHCELNTATKLFCGCANEFGAEPNTNVCPTCLGLPGSLPVLNESAITKAMTLGRAMGCDVQPSVFARKNYFYPDMPKDYQVTQYEEPTNTDGAIELPDGTIVGVERAHIEEDTGKTAHVGGDGRIHGSGHSLVDYNRAGVPLVEIVSLPEIRSSDQARAYVEELRSIVESIGVSDARMDQGSMRVDANVSVRPIGSDELRTRCEIKNINSVRSLGRAIDYEARRHVDLYEAGETPQQQTRHWDEAAGRTREGRSKEDADDYRYFAEPDLVPLEPTVAEISSIDAGLPDSPRLRRERLAHVAGLDASEVAIVVQRGQDGLALDAIDRGADAVKVMARIENELSVEDWSAMTGESLADVIAREAQGELSATQAKQVIATMLEQGGTPEEVIASLGIDSVDGGELATMLDDLIAANPEEWERLLGGDRKLQGFFVGQIMRATEGQADGKVVQQLLGERLGTAG